MNVKTNQLLPYQWLAVLATMAFIAYCANPYLLYYLNDDFIHIPLASDGTIGHSNSARHINDLSLFLDYLWAANNPVGYHFTNLCLHLCNLFLLIRLLQKIAAALHIVLSKNLVIASVLLFGVYAFHAETIFWILCRTASLSLLLVLMAWLFLLECPKKWWLIFPSISCFVLGLFTYEATWVYPVWLLFFWFLVPKANQAKRQFLPAIITTWVLFLAYFPLRIRLTGEALGTYEASDISSFNLPAMAGKCFRLFFRTFLPPFQNTNLFLLLAGIVMVLLAGLLFFLIAKKCINRLWIAFFIFWLLSYLPYISLGVSVTGYESDRYLYFPSAFFCCWLVYSLHLVLRKKRVANIVCVSLIFLLHSYYFFIASKDFAAAGRLTKQTMQLVSKQGNAQISFINLPDKWNGIPIFRFGFIDAVNWQTSPEVGKNVVVKSRKVFENRMPTIHIQTDSLFNKVDISFE